MENQWIYCPAAEPDAEYAAAVGKNAGGSG